ncbi:MAG: hypothetical protein H8E85_07700 [Candidatus Marinimicrobia bacterium]|nr:hypothetical protein [Candidatus Neomarinimicrobiota bacterium]
MRTYFLIFLLLCSLFPIDLRVDVSPENIYVGSLIEITVSVENIKNGEVPVFYDLEEKLEVFTVVDKNLTPNSITYFLQIWNVGEIIIPSIPVDLKNNNHEYSRIESNKITLNVLSNISNSSNDMRSIKPMKDIKLTSIFKIGLLLFLFIAGIVGSGYLWKTKTRQNNYAHTIGSFKISALKKSVKEIEELALPEVINSETTENYYLKLSKICRLFFNEAFYIKATEMTSGEIAEHFTLIGIESALINSWKDISQIADMAKYASHIPPIDQFTEDKKDYIELITSFYKIQSQSETKNRYSKFA